MIDTNTAECEFRCTFRFQQGAAQGALAKHLQGHPKVEWVKHPSLPDHPDHERVGKYCPKGAGAVLGANVVITATTHVIDVRGEEPITTKGSIPANAVVIPGTPGSTVWFWVGPTTFSGPVNEYDYVLLNNTIWDAVEEHNWSSVKALFD